MRVQPSWTIFAGMVVYARATIFILSRVVARSCQKRSLSVDGLSLSLKSDLSLESGLLWAGSKKRKKNWRKQEARQRKLVASLHQTKVRAIRSGRQTPSVQEERIGESGQGILRKEGHWMFGPIVIVVVTVNRQTIVMKTVVTKISILW